MWRPAQLHVALTSVHLPPDKRHGSRDRQLVIFCSSYERDAEMRLRQPFTLKSAKDARAPPCAHLVMGDFNTHPGTMAGPAWRCLIPRAATTTGGGRGFDNVQANGDALDIANIRWNVLKLNRHANCRTGQRGLSDHDLCS